MKSIRDAILVVCALVCAFTSAVFLVEYLTARAEIDRILTDLREPTPAKQSIAPNENYSKEARDKLKSLLEKSPAK